MATKTTPLRNALADAFGDYWDNGSLEILAADGTTVLVSFPLGADAFSAAANGVASLAGTPIQAAASATGTATTARLKDSGGTAQLTGLTVGTSGTDVTIDNTSIASGQTVNLTGFQWTESATTA